MTTFGKNAKIDWAKPLQHTHVGFTVRYLGTHDLDEDGKPIKDGFHHLIIVNGKNANFVNDFGQVKAPGKVKGVQQLVTNKSEPKPAPVPTKAAAPHASVSAPIDTRLISELTETIRAFSRDIGDLRSSLTRAISEAAKTTQALNDLLIKTTKQQEHLVQRVFESNVLVADELKKVVDKLTGAVVPPPAAAPAAAPAKPVVVKDFRDIAKTTHS